MKTKAMTLLSKVLILAVCAAFVTGCSHTEKGTLEKKRHELYYVKTVHNDTVFSVEEGFHMNGLHHIILKNGDFNKTYYDSPPGSFIIMDMTDEEYDRYVDGMPLTQGDFTVYTVVDPKTRTLVTVIGEEERNEALTKALSTESYCKIPEEDFEEYMSAWKYNYWKL